MVQSCFLVSGNTAVSETCENYNGLTEQPKRNDSLSVSHFIDSEELINGIAE